MSLFSKNLRYSREKLGLKQDDFAAIGIKKGTYSNYEIGKTEPNFDTLIRLSNFLGLNIEDLLCRDLANQNLDSTKINESNKNAHPYAHLYAHPSVDNEVIPPIPEEKLNTLNKPKQMYNLQVEPSSRSAVPFYNLPVTAGNLGILDVEEMHSNQPDGYIDLECFRGCEQILPVNGVSMEPIVHNGDLIGIKSIHTLVAHNWGFIQTGVIYLIITRDDRMIKYIEDATDSDYIVCSSPNFHPFKVFKGDILQIYRVKAIARGV